MKVVLLGKAAVRDEGLPWITEACACTQEADLQTSLFSKPSSALSTYDSDHCDPQPFVSLWQSGKITLRLLDLVNNQMKVVLLGKAAVRDEGLPWITEAFAFFKTLQRSLDLRLGPLRPAAFCESLAKR
jgi:hypothetical protein